MKKFLTTREHPGEVALLLLILRVQMGVAFIFHGWGKILDPTGWMGPNSDYSSTVLVLVAIIELVGGLLLALGLLTRYAALCICVVMVGAVYHHLSLGDSLVGGWELSALYLTLAVLYLFVGPGRSSLDASLFNQKSR